jgi:hypothetical protein
MNKKKSHLRSIEIPSTANDAVETKHDEYDGLELLEHLESLQEEMEDLGVSTLAEVVERIAKLHHQLDEE